MCELFAVNAPAPFEASEILDEFYSRSWLHPDGWGLALLDGKGGVTVHKEPICAEDSRLLGNLLKNGIKSQDLIAHIRYATVGNFTVANTHPFTAKDLTGRKWTLAHNGTIFKFDPMERFIKKQEGDTDSERFLLYIIDRINQATLEKGRELNVKERFEVVDKIILEAAKDNKLNILLHDGEQLMAHYNTKDGLNYAPYQKGAVISTTPLTDIIDRQFWKTLPQNTLLSFKDGNLVRRGTRHNYEFIRRNYIDSLAS